MLTVNVINFEKQIKYLLDDGYTFYSVGEIIRMNEAKTILKDKAVTLTFDDAYLNNLTYLIPVLKKYSLKACIFIPVSFIGKTNIWDGGSDRIMNLEQLLECQPYFEYGLHSYSHDNLATISINEFKADLSASQQELNKLKLNYFPVLAFPFGQYYKDKIKLTNAKEALADNGIKLAFRIGNAINSWPLKDPYLVKRIDIKGTDSFWEFKTKLKKGKVKVF
ncbi:MAG: polysaccharide deacetylase family protein [Opitutaceae bacterium]|nr:polysaccharide deacetylase family protein [Cytophagales bacterium]